MGFTLSKNGTLVDPSRMKEKASVTKIQLQSGLRRNALLATGVRIAQMLVVITARKMLPATLEEDGGNKDDNADIT